MKFTKWIAVLVLFLGTMAGLAFNLTKSKTDITRNVDIKKLPEGTRLMIHELQSKISEGNIATQPFLMEDKLQLIRWMKDYILWVNSGWRSKMIKVHAEALMMAGHSREAIEEMHFMLSDLELLMDTINYLNEEYAKFLAVANLRMGEQDNCLLNHNPKSCTIPFVEEAVHQNREGAEQAVKLFTRLLKHNPCDLGNRWLLNIAYMALGEYPHGVPPDLLIPLSDDYSCRPDAFPRFHNIAGKLGVDVNKVSGSTIVDDFNNDGLLDIVASSYGITDQLRYFENTGNGFVDKTAESGLAGLVGGLNIMQTDYNNDGLLDIFVLRGAWFGLQGNFPNSLIKNLGNGKFEDVTVAAGLLSFYPTQAACWGDFNNDGWVDVFIGNEVVDEEKYLDDPVYDSTNVNPSELYMNNGDGTFTNVAEKLNLEIYEYVKGATWTDYNNDGLPDLVVSILGRDNKLFRNDGGTDINNWKFTDVSEESGIAQPVFSFPVWSFDVNNDGWEDLFFGDYNDAHHRVPDEYAGEMLGLPTMFERPALYINNQDGTFTDHTDSFGLDKVLFAMGCNFGDLDNDGYLDFYIGTGSPSYEAIVPNRMFRNHEGKYFEEVTFSGGFGIIQKGHGVSFADIDNDGDQDVYIVMGGAYQGDNFPNALYENPGNSHSWITIKLQGVKSNRAAIGARLKVVASDQLGNERTITRLVSSGGSFGANPFQAQIGLGHAVTIRELTVTWPDARQTVQRFENIAVNQFIRITEGSDAIIAEERPRVDLKHIPEKKAGTPHCHL